ncbi:MAG: hypothetical protein QXT34_01940 [Candidatus Aenigmatarchaeota archaeon]
MEYRYKFNKKEAEIEKDIKEAENLLYEAIEIATEMINIITNFKYNLDKKWLNRIDSFSNHKDIYNGLKKSKEYLDALDRHLAEKLKRIKNLNIYEIFNSGLSQREEREKRMKITNIRDYLLSTKKILDESISDMDKAERDLNNENFKKASIYINFVVGALEVASEYINIKLDRNLKELKRKLKLGKM